MIQRMSGFRIAFDSLYLYNAEPVLQSSGRSIILILESNNFVLLKLPLNKLKGLILALIKNIILPINNFF